MIGGDEVIFCGAYKGFKLGVRYDVSGSSEKDVACLLSGLSGKLEPAAYQFSDIDTKKIDAFANPSGKGLEAVLSFLQKNPQSAIKKELLSACPDANLLPAAESFLFNRLLTKAGVAFKPPGVSSLKAESEDSDDQIMFVGRFGKWMAVKKLSLEKVEDWEVSAILSGINNTILIKAFDFSGAQKNDKLVSELIGGRKSFGNLLAALEKLKGRLSGNELEDAYVVNKLFTELGYHPYASLFMLVKAHPDVKPKKPKGRAPKG
ncbi:MAG: DUF2666 family protein [Candidatus Micrarchaeota archaeon]